MFMCILGSDLVLLYYLDQLFSNGVIVGNIDSTLITEASGCAASRQFDNIIYTHNDHGDSPRIFAVDATNAKLVAVLDIERLVKKILLLNTHVRLCYSVYLKNSIDK